MVAVPDVSGLDVRSMVVVPDMITVVIGVVIAVVVAVVALFLFRAYQSRKAEAALRHELAELENDISYMIDRKGVYFPKLISNKLNAAEHYLKEEDYEELERVLDDIADIIVQS